MKKSEKEKVYLVDENLKESEAKPVDSDIQKPTENQVSESDEGVKEIISEDIDEIPAKQAPPTGSDLQIDSPEEKAIVQPEIELEEKVESPPEQQSSSTPEVEGLKNIADTDIEKNKISDEIKVDLEQDASAKKTEEIEIKDKNTIPLAKKELDENTTDSIKGDSGEEIDTSTEHKEKKDEKTDNPDEKEQHLDYSNYSKKQMVQVLDSLMKEDDVSQVGRILKEIKKPYDKIEHSEREDAYNKYVADGGEKDGFEYRPDELDQRFQLFYSKLKERKNQYFNSLEKQKEQNLKIKLEILEKLRELVDSEETGVSIKSIKDLQKQWKEVGSIASSQVKGLWANYNALLDRYYDQRSIYYELKELDRKKNYDLKIELCERALQLSDDNDIREAIKKLNELHEEFKHIGPVPKDDQEVVWGRFKAASDKVYSRRKEYYEKLKDEFKINEVAKEGLLEKVLPYAEFASDKISDWNSKTKEIISIQKEWEAIGSLPKEKAKSINKQFWTSFKSFFNKKGQFFKKIEEDRKGNLILKQELVEKAVAFKDSDDFRKIADELKGLQKQWKEIGPVPEKYRNEVFKQFKKACDYFFDRRRANSGKIEKEYEENLKIKKSLCEELKKMLDSEKIDIDRVKSIEAEWGEIGFVPKSSINSIQKQFTDTISKVADNVDIPEAEKHKLRFSAQFNKMNYGPGAEKLLQKKEGALRRQISNLENDINLWNNNLDFFASSKNADKLKEEFMVRINKAGAQLKRLKEELKVINSI